LDFILIFVIFICFKLSAAGYQLSAIPKRNIFFLRKLSLFLEFEAILCKNLRAGKKIEKIFFRKCNRNSSSFVISGER